MDNVERALNAFESLLELATAGVRPEAVILERLAKIITDARDELAALKEVDSPVLVTTHRAARILGISPRTLEKWRLCGGGPVYCKLGKCVRYAIDDLNNFTTKGLEG